MTEQEVRSLYIGHVAVNEALLKGTMTLEQALPYISIPVIREEVEKKLAEAAKAPKSEAKVGKKVEEKVEEPVVEEPKAEEGIELAVEAPKTTKSKK